MAAPRTTTEYNQVLTWNLTRVASFGASVYLKVLSVLVRWVHYIFRFNAIKRLEKYLHAWSRDLNAAGLVLPKVTHADVERIETQIPAPDDKNIVLTGTLFLPVERAGKKLPAVLIRTPYDRNSPLLGPRMAEMFAERGYACMMQDTRGRFGSGGDFFPIVHEVNDGATTVAWLREQPWSNGKVGTFGISYLGMTSYASANKERVDACVPVMAASRLYPVLFHGGNTFAFDLIVRWLWLVMNLMHERNPFSALWKVLTPEYQLYSALHPAGEVPIHHRDQDVVGKELHFYRDVYNAKTLEHEFWTEKDKLCDLTDGAKRPPLNIVAGWYDFFIKQSFEDFLAASKSSPNTSLKLICGSWCHFDLHEYSPLGFVAAFNLFEAELHRDAEDAEANEAQPHELILHVINSEKPDNARGTWLKFHSWPPPNTRDAVFGFRAGGKLEQGEYVPTGQAEEDFTQNNYNPEDPTPHAGGLSFNWANSGKMWQNDLEKREDVAVFTSPPFANETTMVGHVICHLALESNNPHTDIFVKLCDVDAQGKSRNVLEKIMRLSPENTKWDAAGRCQVEMDLGPVAAMVQPGHAVRVQVSGGAHPAYLRHPGIEDHTSMKLKSAQRKIFHDSSYLLLPILQ